MKEKKQKNQEEVAASIKMQTDTQDMKNTIAYMLEGIDDMNKLIEIYNYIKNGDVTLYALLRVADKQDEYIIKTLKMAKFAYGNYNNSKKVFDYNGFECNVDDVYMITPNVNDIIETYKHMASKIINLSNYA